jgi:xylulokinase
MDKSTAENHSDLLLGIDIGTTNCKVAVGDPSGQIIESVALPCRLYYPRPGRVEVDPEKGWWEPFLVCLKKIFDLTGIDGRAICGVGVSCTNGLVCLDSSGMPVRNAIMQIDRRTDTICHEIEATIGRDEIRDITGIRVAPGTCSAPSLLWIKREQPNRYQRIDTILSPTGYFVHRLTGRRVMDRTRAATTLLYDIRNGAWSERMLERLEIPERLLPSILSPYEVAGEITREAADLTGLNAGTPVVAGCMDSVAAAIGMGTTGPGAIGIVLGTVGRLLWPLESSTFDDRFINIPLIEPDRWMSVACTNGTGLSVSWFIMNLIAAEEFSLKQESHQIFDKESAESPPGSRGILYLPYLAGERSPIWNPWAKGVFFGLDRGHTRGDLARAVMEGTSFSIRENLEILESVTGTRPERICLSGGGSRSPIWPDILSSVLKRDLEVSQLDDSECAGMLMLSAVGTGMVGIDEILSRRPSDSNWRISANREAGNLYDEIYAQYKDLYATLEPHFKRLHDTISTYDHEEGTPS